MQEKVVIIGSNSFSGAHFVDYCLRNNPDCEVIGISRSEELPACFLPYKKISDGRFTFKKLDINLDIDAILSTLDKFEPDYVINFAAQGMVGQSWDDPEQWFNTNCIAVLNLGRALAERRYLKRYVHISTPEVYGSSSGEREEEARFRPSTPYAASKAAGDLALFPYFLHKGLPLVYTRATNVYGPYQQLYRIVPRTVFFAKLGKKIQLHGGGESVKSFIHIRDVCDATLNIARNGNNGEVYHISPNEMGISIRELVSLVLARMGKRVEDHVEVIGERLGQDAAYIINSEKLRSTLGWSPTIDLEQGIDEVITWVDEFWHELIEQNTEYVHKR